jgi:transposase-like protein
MFDPNTLNVYVDIFGGKSNMMKAFFDATNASPENDDKTHFNDFERYLKEMAFIGMQGLFEEITQQHTQAKHYERNKKRHDYRNGYERKNLKLPKIGEIAILRPTVRNHPKEHTTLLPLKEIPEAFRDFVVDIFLSSRSADVTKRLLLETFSINVSKTSILNYLNKFENAYKAWRERPLKNNTPHVFLDGKWVAVRHNGEVKKMVMLTAIGMNEDCKLDVLGFTLCESENHDDVFALLQNLKSRGLTDVVSVTADQGAGFETAIKATWIDAEYLPCSVHKLHNILQNAKNPQRGKFMVKEAAKILRSRQSKRRAKMLDQFKRKWEKREPRAVRNFLKNIDDYYRYLAVTKNERIRTRIHSTNPIERYFREVERKVAQIGYFRSKQRARLWFFLIVRNVSSANSEKYIWSTSFLQE